MIELLAITGDGALPAPPLRAVRCGALQVVFAPAGEGQADADALWQREAVLERLMETCDVLPVRLGTVVADERAAVDAIAPRQAGLSEALERVRGAVELSVRAVASEADPRPAGEPSGHEYLRERVARARLARQLHEPLAALARDSVVQDGPDLLRAAYLVERGAVDTFVARFRELQSERRELAAVCTGPWPPYSFTGEEAA